MRHPRYHALLATAVLLTGLAWLGAGAGRPDPSGRVEALLRSPSLAPGRWGGLVVDAATGEVVYQRDADDTFIPASTHKLFFGAAALIEFGPDHRWTTPVFRRGPVVDGRLQGDLILVASGDLTLGGRTLPDGHMAFTGDDHTYANHPSARSEVTPTDPLAGLKELARQVSESGIRAVEGDVLIDDRFFAKAQGSGSGPGLLTPVVINDNLIDFVVHPAERTGDPPRVELRPETGLIQVQREVDTAPAGTAARLAIHSVGPRRFAIRGTVPAGGRAEVRTLPVTDPTRVARGYFIEALRRQGVRVAVDPWSLPGTGLPEAGDYAGLTQVAAYTSPPFSELLRVTLKASVNIYANSFPLLIAARHGERTLAEGLARQRQALRTAGVNLDQVGLATAAGGAPGDRTTPRALVQLLRRMAARPDYPTFRAALPVLGVDGTLEGLAPPRSPVRGRVFAKTGTMFVEETAARPPYLKCKGLAGEMTTSSGRRLFFAWFVNDLPMPRGSSPDQIGRTLGRLCEILYLDAPGG
jgi:D-alanyl-D-alanine carboxypeptidase/D-alanyl-D-alanine-endopeptidase (penicillin-binding protein 4)